MERVLKRAKVPTKMVQAELCSLAKGRDDLDALLRDTEENENNRDHEIFHCKLNDSRMGLDSEKVPGWEFYYGVVKIQNDDIASMTPSEHEACECLLISAEATNETSATSLTHEDRMNNFKKQCVRGKFFFTGAQ